MKDILTYLIKNIVNKPEMVSINELHSNGFCLLEIEVAPEDRGVVLGKKGSMLNSLRTYLYSIASKNNIFLQIRLIE